MRRLLHHSFSTHNQSQIIIFHFQIYIEKIYVLKLMNSCSFITFYILRQETLDLLCTYQSNVLRRRRRRRRVLCTYVQYTRVLTSGRPSALLKINNAKLGDHAERSRGRTEQRSARSGAFRCFQVRSGACASSWDTRVQPGVVLTPMLQPRFGSREKKRHSYSELRGSPNKRS